MIYLTVIYERAYFSLTDIGSAGVVLKKKSFCVCKSVVVWILISAPSFFHF